MWLVEEVWDTDVERTGEGDVIFINKQIFQNGGIAWLYSTHKAMIDYVCSRTNNGKGTFSEVIRRSGLNGRYVVDPKFSHLIILHYLP